MTGWRWGAGLVQNQRPLTEIKDQNETVHALDYDGLGRQTQDRITTFGTGVDATVRRIASTFEVRGMREKITGDGRAGHRQTRRPDPRAGSSRRPGAFWRRGRGLRQTAIQMDAV